MLELQDIGSTQLDKTVQHVHVALPTLSLSLSHSLSLLPCSTHLCPHALIRVLPRKTVRHSGWVWFGRGNYFGYHIKEVSIIERDNGVRKGLGRTLLIYSRWASPFCGCSVVLPTGSFQL